MFWRTIQESADEGIAEFDLGRSSVDNEGLVRFEERWGASRGALQYWPFPRTPKSDAHTWKAHLGKMLVRVVPDQLLIAAGEILYPHLG